MCRVVINHSQFMRQIMRQESSTVPRQYISLTSPCLCVCSWVQFKIIGSNHNRGIPFTSTVLLEAKI